MQIDGRKWLFTAALPAGLAGGQKVSASLISGRPGVVITSGGGGVWSLDFTALMPAGSLDSDVEIGCSVSPGGTPGGWSWQLSSTGTPGSHGIVFKNSTDNTGLDIAAVVTAYLRLRGQVSSP